jgi:hypothetical protein
MATLKVEILKRYKALSEHIVREIGYDIFPALGEVDATDIVCLVCQFFSACPAGEYRSTIINLAYFRGIFLKTEQLEKVYPEVREFIDFVLEAARKND